MKLDVQALIKSIGNSDILGIGKDKEDNFYITQGHFIVKVDKELLVDNIRIARTIKDDFNVDDVEQLLDSIGKNKLLFKDNKEVFLSNVFQHIEDYSQNYEKVAIMEHNIDEKMTLLENKVSRRQIVVNYEYLSMVKECSDVLGSGQFNPVLIMHNNDMVGYILPMRIANKKDYFKSGRNN